MLNATDKYEYNRLLYRIAASPYDCLEFCYVHKIVVGLIQASIETVVADHRYKHELAQVDSSGRTPLHWAATRANISALKALLRARVNVKAEDYEGRTPLHCAAISGNRRCIELLLIAGSDVLAKDRSGTQATHFALEWSVEVETLYLLLMAGADIESKTNDGSCALLVACCFASLEDVQALLVAGANVNCQDNDEDTPLFEATHYNRVEIIELLLHQGARLEHQNKLGHTILHVLALWGENETITSFMSCQLDKLNIDQQDKESKTAWDLLQDRAAPPEGFKEAFEGLLARCKAQRDARMAAEPVEIGE